MVFGCSGGLTVNRAIRKVSSRTPVGLIFAENENDAEALKNLAYAIRPDLPRMSSRRKPLVLIKDRKAAEDRKRNAAQIAAVIFAAEVECDVKFVVAHQDCDAIEPAHLQLTELIDKELVAAGLRNVLSVAPAWETEAWWFLWPDAVARVNSKWNRLKRSSNHGTITNAKEALRRDLRSAGARDYEESDARQISANVRSMGIISKRLGHCCSFLQYEQKILDLK